jgi:hypothetical protein
LSQTMNPFSVLAASHSSSAACSSMRFDRKI